MNYKKEKILNLSKFIFEDIEFNKIQLLLKRNRLNDIRLIVSEKIELLELIKNSSEHNDILDLQIKYCNELEDIVLDYYLELN